MAEKKSTASEITIEGKYILAVYDVPKSNRKELETRRILQGVHIYGDEAGWMVEACDSYKLARVESGACGGYDGKGFVIPPETVEDVKASDVLTFKPNGDGTCHLAKLSKGHVTEWDFRPIEGRYPQTDKLIARKVPCACYRNAITTNADYIGCLMGVVKKALGKGATVEVATQEGAKPNAVIAYAGDDDTRLTMLFMPVNGTARSRLGKAVPLGKDGEAVEALRKERDELEANAEMWKAKALELEAAAGEAANGGGGRVEELESEVEQLRKKAERWEKRAEEEKAKRVGREEARMDGKLKELEAELSRARKELEQVWKENESLKARLSKAGRKAQGAASAAKEVPPAPRPPRGEDGPQAADRAAEEALAVVTLEYMEAWAAERGLLATQKRPGCCIWVEGESKPHAAELKELGFRFTGKRKSWYLDPKRAA